MVISWCEDLLCLPIVMTLRDFFPILFPAGVGCALQICFLGMGLILWTSLPEPLADPRRFLNHLLRNLLRLLTVLEHPGWSPW